jgi:branched-chain amino acid transport system substrate-binding protein
VLQRNAEAGGVVQVTGTTAPSATVPETGNSGDVNGVTPPAGSAQPGTAVQPTAGASTASGAVPVGGATSASTGGQPPVAPANGSTIELGQIGTYSGLLGSFFVGGRTGTQAWVKYVNSHGGLNGHPVNLITADDDGDPSTALSEAKTMVEQDHVIAFVGIVNALTQPTVAPYLQQMGVPAVGGLDFESAWFTNPMYFPTGGDPRIQIDGAMKDGIASGHTKVGVVVCVEVPFICNPVTQAVQKDTHELGGSLVYNATASIAQPDYTTVCLDAKKAGVNNFVLGLDPASIDRLVDDCANQDFHPHYTTTSLLAQPALRDTKNTVGLTFAGPVFPYMVRSAATSQFDQAMIASTGQQPDNEQEALGWTAGLLMSEASKDLPAKPTSSDVLAGLYQIHNETFGGLTSPLSFTRGQPTPSPTCYYLITVGTNGFDAPSGLQPHCLPASFSSQDY